MIKKMFHALLMLCLCVGIAGCSSTSPEDTQKKIESVGWKIELTRDVGTAIDQLVLQISNYDSFTLTRNKESDTIKSLDFLSGSEADYDVIAYDYEKKENYLAGHYIKDAGDTVMTCLLYNIDKEEEYEGMSGMEKCNFSESDQAKANVEQRDDYLSKADIGMDELHAWAVWYYANH